MFLQRGAIIATVAVEMVVTTVIINFFGTIWGSGRQLVTNLPIRWFYTGMVFYALTCLQCAMQVTLTFQAVIHFSDWVVGHAHLVMFGVFSMWLLGIMTYLFPRLWRTEWYSRELCEWHFWLSAVGVFVMAADLTLAGLFQGYYWASLQAVGRVDRRVDAVLDPADLRRPDDAGGPGVLRLQHLSHVADLATRTGAGRRQPGARAASLVAF